MSARTASRKSISLPPTAILVTMSTDFGKTLRSARKIILFLDVDGVFTVYRGQERDPWFAKVKLSAWLIPHHVAILRTITDNPILHPVWLSC